MKLNIMAFIPFNKAFWFPLSLSDSTQSPEFHLSSTLF